MRVRAAAAAAAGMRRDQLSQALEAFDSRTDIAAAIHGQWTQVALTVPLFTCTWTRESVQDHEQDL